MDVLQLRAFRSPPYTVRSCSLALLLTGLVTVCPAVVISSHVGSQSIFFLSSAIKFCLHASGITRRTITASCSRICRIFKKGNSLNAIISMESESMCGWIKVYCSRAHSVTNHELKRIKVLQILLRPGLASHLCRRQYAPLIRSQLRMRMARGIHRDPAFR